MGSQPRKSGGGLSKIGLAGRRPPVKSDPMFGPDLSSIARMSLLTLFFGYLGLAGFALLFANRLTFPVPQSSYVDGPESLKFTSPSGTRVTLRYLPNPESPFLIFYHHGNGEDLGTIESRLDTLYDAGFAVLAWDYPGYGTSDGHPTEESLLEIAAALLESIPATYGYPIERTVPYGRSLGGGPATWLAARYPVAGLILEGTFTSIFRVGLPVNILPWDLFDNRRELAEVRCPVLILHGTDDETVPFKHGKELYAIASGTKFFAWFDGGRHNNLIEAFPQTYHDSLHTFQAHLRQGAALP